MREWIYLLLIVEAIVGVLVRAWVKVFDDVIGLSLQKMMVTVFDQVIFDLFPADVALALSIDPREGGVRLESLQPAKWLSLPLDRYFFLSYRDQ